MTGIILNLNNFPEKNITNNFAGILATMEAVQTQTMATWIIVGLVIRDLGNLIG